MRLTVIAASNESDNLGRIKMYLRYSLAVVLLASSFASHAMPIYSYTTDDFRTDVLEANGGARDRGGDIQSLSTSFDSSTNDFTWSYTAQDVGGNEHNGFWLVVSDGENPKGNVDEYAILYGDLEEGRVSAFVYTGQNNPNSYNTTPLLGIFDNSITVTENAGVQEVSVSLNATEINNYSPEDGWDGVAYGASLGIWFHPVAGPDVNFSYDAVGQLTGFDRGVAGYYDLGLPGIATTQVPEPASFALLLIGGAGLLAARRKRIGELVKRIL